jgi:hypothetical protein
VATTIVFTATGEMPLSVNVEEGPDDVLSALRDAGGREPFVLTGTGDVPGAVWINPTAIAYWHEAH